MHIPDGYLGPVTYGGLWAVMVPIWMYASRKVKQSVEVTQIPFLAMASAFSMVAMIFTFPLPGGTTGHITGSTLVAVLLGPWAAILAVSTALFIQALVFGDGGITAIGANCFNVAFVGVLTGFSVYRVFVKACHKLFKIPLSDQATSSRGLLYRLIGAGVASYLAINLGGFFAAIELGLQPYLHGTGPQASTYFPFPLKIAIPAMMIPHLTAVGLLEVTVTVLVLLLIFKWQPKMTTLWKMLPAFFAVIALWTLPTHLWAHDFWIEMKGEELLIVYGHGTQRLEFDSAQVKGIKVFDLQSKEMNAQREKKKGGVLINTEGRPSLLFAEIDHGYWSKTIYGWKNLPKRQASRVVESIRSFYYTKAIFSWNETVQKAIPQAKLDILPLENPFELKSGDLFSLRVLHLGKPISGLDVEGGDHQKQSVTDKEGVGKVKLVKGHQVISVNYKESVKNDPDADFVTMTSTLTFEVTK